MRISWVTAWKVFGKYFWPHIGFCAIIKGPILLAQEALVLYLWTTKRWLMETQDCGGRGSNTYLLHSKVQCQIRVGLILILVVVFIKIMRKTHCRAMRWCRVRQQFIKDKFDIIKWFGVDPGSQHFKFWSLGKVSWLAPGEGLSSHKNISPEKLVLSYLPWRRKQTLYRRDK